MAKYFVQQYGFSFFTVAIYEGYMASGVDFGTEITPKEYKKLYYSGERTVIYSWDHKNARAKYIRINGIASIILDRYVKTIIPK